MDDVGIVAQVAGQPLGAGQGFAGADHVLWRAAEDVLVLLYLLEHLPRLFQALFGRLLVGAAAEQSEAEQQAETQWVFRLH
ncbi:hypothetical protein D9M68_788650 [compost metagenome]